MFVPAEVELPKEGTVLPFTAEGGLPFLEVMINDHGPYRLLLDTGAAVLTLSERVADELGLPESHNKSIAITATGTEIIASKIVRVDRLCLGSAKFTNLKATVSDLSIFHQAGFDFDGILGFLVFRECLLTIDFPKENLKLKRGKLQRLDKLQTVPARISKGVPRIPVLIGLGTPNQHVIDLIVDTGCTGGMVLPLKAKAYRIPSTPAGESTVVTTAEVFRVHLVQLKTKVVVGDCIIENPIVSYAGNIGMIGAKLLRPFVITFDQKQRLVHITHDKLPINKRAK